MTKAGRKRKQRSKRQPSGKANSWEDPRALGLARRIRDQMHRDMANPMYGFPLGILHTTKFINDDEFNAGIAWVKATYEFAQVEEIPLLTPRAISFDRVHGKSTKVISDERVKEIRQRKREYDGVVATADDKGLSMMIATCIEDREAWSPVRLRNVLRALAEYRSGKKRVRQAIDTDRHLEEI